MKKSFFLFILLYVGCFKSIAQLQITGDTLVCRGQSLELQGNFVNFQIGQIDTNTTINEFGYRKNIGFPFQYFGQTYNQFRFGLNCLMMDNNAAPFFVQSGSGIFSIDTSALYLLRKTIMLGYQRFTSLGSPFSVHQTLGSVGYRKVIIQICSLVRDCPTPHFVTNQAILYEGSNIIEIHTRSMPATPICPNPSLGGNRAIQGLRYVEPANGTVHEVFSPGRGPGDFWGNNNTDTAYTARRFTPVPGNPMAYTVDTIPYNPTHIILSVDSSAFSWHDATGTLLGNGPSLTFVPQAPPLPATSTFFVLRYTGPAGCDTLASLADTAWVHFGEGFGLQVDSMCPDGSYAWMGRTLSQPGTYDSVMAGASATGCDSIARLELHLEHQPQVLIAGGDSAHACAGGPHTLRAQATGASPAAYQWTFNGNDLAGATADTLRATQAGSYGLRYRSQRGCWYEAPPQWLAFVQPPQPRLSASRQHICAGDTATLRAGTTGAALHHWTPEAFFAGSPTGALAVARVPATSLLRVQATDQYGCSGTDTLTLFARECCGLDLPNAFTPNGDGRNDEWDTKTGPGRQLQSVQVFNRWGKMVFESRGSGQKVWNGQDQRGKPMPAGVYMYQVEYKCSDGSVHRKSGDVTLIQ